MAKITIAKVEIGQAGKDCRIILSNGDELGGICGFEASAVTPAGGYTVNLTARITDEKPEA
ncbi:hypothetical protein [Paracoccus sp. (in: a-proteobacteria)]|uniref:hypothetical protein n=1 Tax=Paracoccus sp. TaxID=267 RepID=UPI00289A5153|nr:hypothetical protein [Paracoccus sp. (in: a-proteobacteria)]